MDIQTTKIELVRMILDIDNQSLIEKIIAFMKQETPDFWTQLPTSQKEEIEIGINQLNRGERIEFNEFLKKVS